MRYLFVLVSIVYGAWIVGCTFAPTPVKSTSTMSLDTILDVEIWASNSCIKPGETIQVRASVTNRGDKTQVIDLKNKPIMDLTVFSVERTQRWSEGKALTSDLTHLKLAPGESRTIEMEYTENSSKKGGPLVSEATFLYSADAPGGPLTPRVTINVGACPGFGP